MQTPIPQDRPALDPHPLSPYVAWAGGRNRDPILGMFQRHFRPHFRNVLEFATGSGMHVNYFAPHFRNVSFQPSDRDDTVFDNIRRLRDEQGNPNVLDPRRLDLTDAATWPQEEWHYDAIYCINIFQVAPITIADGMMRCASKLLTGEGFLSIYGPFKVDGAHTTETNKSFDEEVRSAGVAEWGLKDVADLRQAAAAHGMKLRDQIDMPANNFLLLFGRA
jgi:hypothetical protein